MTIFNGYNGDLYVKIRYNLNHEGTALRWRLFVKDGDKEEVMYLCKHINFYKPGQTYAETIGGVGQYSILIKADKIRIDDDTTGWVM